MPVIPKKGKGGTVLPFRSKGELVKVGPGMDGSILGVDVLSLLAGDVRKRVSLVDTDDDTIGAELSESAIRQGFRNVELTGGESDIVFVFVAVLLSVLEGIAGAVMVMVGDEIARLFGEAGA